MYYNSNQPRSVYISNSESKGTYSSDYPEDFEAWCDLLNLLIELDGQHKGIGPGVGAYAHVKLTVDDLRNTLKEIKAEPHRYCGYDYRIIEPSPELELRLEVWRVKMQLIAPNRPKDDD